MNKASTSIHWKKKGSRVAGLTDDFMGICFPGHLLHWPALWESRHIAGCNRCLVLYKNGERGISGWKKTETGVLLVTGRPKRTVAVRRVKPMSKIITCEQVSDGHPDKICDQVADAIVTDCLKHDRDSRVAVECLLKDSRLVIAGELTSKHQPDYRKLADEDHQPTGDFPHDKRAVPGHRTWRGQGRSRRPGHHVWIRHE